MSVTANAQPVDHSDYRIVLSYDGLGDKDDIGAAAFAIAMIGEANMQDNLVQVNFFDFPGQSAESKRELPVSVLEGLDKWGMSRDIAFNYQEEKAAAIGHFKKIVDDETSSGQIYIACGGPMTATLGMVNAIPEAKRSKITAVSHSRWNDWVKQPDWSDVVATGIHTLQIHDQNRTAFSIGRGGDWQEQWKWLKDKGGKYEWLHRRNKFDYKFDISDAGIAYYLVTGGENQHPSISDIRALFGTPASETVKVSKLTTEGLHIIKGVKHVSVDHVKVGQSVELWHEIQPHNATNQNVHYSTGDASVATVDPNNGIVTGVALGAVTISVASADGNKTASIEVEVVESGAAHEEGLDQ